MFKKRLTILLLLSIVFFFVYSYLTPASIFGKLAWGHDFAPIFNSPDETSTYFFSKLFAETGRLSQIEPLDFLAPGLIHPRSILVNSAGYLVPGSFLGMPLIYGSLAKIFNIVSRFDLLGRSNLFTSFLIPFFTPLFAVLGVIAFYFLLRKIWGGNTAFLSAVLLFFLPPFWYYSTRGLFPNVLFVSLLVISAAFFFGIPITRSTANDGAKYREKVYEYVRYVGGGLFLGLALITRTSEIVWLGILAVFLFIVVKLRYRSLTTINWPAAILGFVAFCAVFVPVFYQNQMLYGSAFSFGYNISAIQNNNFETSLLPNHTEQNTEQHGSFLRSSAIKNIFCVVQRFVLPFGIHPRAVWQNFWNYFIKFFWWFTIPTLLGCLIFIFRVVQRTIQRSSAIKSNISSAQILYFLSFAFISVWLFIYYGSWQFSDNINLQKITIGNSYLRYWLPIFVMGLPFVVLFFRKFLSLFKTKCAKTTVLVSLLIFIFSASAISVFAGEDEGIFYVKNQLLRYNGIRENVLDLTEENAVIITERSDKIFFPSRRVIVWKRGEALDENFKNLSKFVPLYYYNIAFTNEEFNIFNQELRKLDLRLELVKVFGNEALYKLISNIQYPISNKIINIQ